MNAVWTDHAQHRIDLGDEPPLTTTDNRRGPPDRRGVSIRWLASTVLAALASTSLMSGALYAALDGRPPVLVVGGPALAAVMPEDADPGDLLAKADLPDLAAEAALSRQVLRVSTISRDGERDIIRVRPFARVTTPLAASAETFTAEIPAFNPLRIFAEANDPPTDRAMTDTLYGADVDGEMVVQVTDFPVASPALIAFSPLDAEETEAAVREQAQFMVGSNVEIASLPLVDPGRFDFGFAERGAFEQFGVRIIPENVSFVAKSGEQLPGEAALDEKIATAERGDSFESLLIDNEATDEEAVEIEAAFRSAYDIGRLDPGDRLRIILAPSTDAAEAAAGRYQPVRVSLYRDGVHAGTIARSDHAGYVAAEEPGGGIDLFADADRGGGDGPRPRLYESLYQTALANEMSPRLIDELIRIVSYDVDFNARISSGDSVDVLYSLAEDESETADASEIIYAALTLGGRTHRYYRYRTPDDGSVDYYDESGKSSKKFLMRKPMSAGTFRGGFGMRRHPLLGYSRMHTGVDWSAPRGTPIMSAGDGRLAEVGWKSGYGNYIRVEHANGYSSAYAHMTGFAKGMAKGTKVRQGQVIGFVGSTGLSTGPHLHYEILVNDRQVDPMRIRLPDGRTLDGEMQAVFESERSRIDALIGGNPPTKLASAVEGTGG